MCAERLGGEYHEHRGKSCLPQPGPDQDLQSLPQPRVHRCRYLRLRTLHAEMDRAILACYGWQDLDPQHGFYQNDRGQTRFTVPAEARRELLKRLLELNLAIASAERAQSIANQR